MARVSTSPPIPIDSMPRVNRAGGNANPSRTPRGSAPWRAGADRLLEPTDGINAGAMAGRAIRGNRKRGAFLSFVIVTRDGEKRDNAVLAENEKFEVEIKTCGGTAELSMTVLEMNPSRSKLEIRIKGRHGTDSEEDSAASQGYVSRKAVALVRATPVKISTGRPEAQSFVEITYEGFRPMETPVETD